MRVLLVIPDLACSTGGPVTAVLGLAEALAGRGVEVSLVATDFGLDGLPRLERVRTRLFPCRLFRHRRYAPGLWDYLRREAQRHDLVSLHTLWQYPTLAAGSACRRARVPYLLTPHGMLDPWALGRKAWRKRVYLRLIESAALRGAAAIQMTSEAEWRDSYPERWNSSVFVLPLGLPRDAWADLPDPARFGERFPALRGHPLILFLGRLHPKKQPEIVLRSFQRVSARDPEARLVLAGPGPADYVAGLERLARQLGIGDRVVFTGLLRGRAVQEAYRAAALFVLPSWQENFGYSVAEAMAAGCPVIVSDHVDLAPEIEKGGAGMAVAPTIEATAEAMERLLGDAALRGAMGENGRRLVLERYTWERVVDDLLRVYDDILTGRRRSAAWRLSHERSGEAAG